MTISVGDTLPDVTLIHKAGDLAEIKLSEFAAGKRVLLVGMPGAYTGTCDQQHIPTIVENADAIRAKGIDEIAVVTVNDAFVTEHWGTSTGATAAGIKMLADWNADFAKATGLAFSAPPVGLKDRMQRSYIVADDGKVTLFDTEEPGTCDATAGRAILDKL
ncbi:MAG: peroxiredoxin [Pseudomonadota bacterium]